jgi:hypothetical protein
VRLNKHATPSKALLKYQRIAECSSIEASHFYKEAARPIAPLGIIFEEPLVDFAVLIALPMTAKIPRHYVRALAILQRKPTLAII